MDRAPEPPAPREERVLLRILQVGFLRGLFHEAQDAPPAAWGAQPFGIPRSSGGLLAGLLFPVDAPRGIVLLGHPGIPPGKGYFHRSDRIPFLRERGFAVATFDHGGFGESDDPTRLYHEEWADVLAWARRRFPDLPVHVWGVSIGGYFAHHALAAADEPGVASAIFDQVAPDLLHYKGEGVGSRRIAGLVGAVAAPSALKWFPAEAHALHVKADRVLYVTGAKDAGIPIEHARRLVAHANPLARHHVVEDARHLEAWKLGGDKLRRAVQDALDG